MVDPITKLVTELTKLPSIGEKTAVRLAYHLMKADEQEVRALAEALITVKSKIRFCEQCFTFSEEVRCHLCQNHEREAVQICVVEKPSDVFAIERAYNYRGLYHVLHGVLSPLDGVGPDHLKIRELIARIKNGAISELILALNPSVEGEATASYLAKILEPLDIKVSKIAHGLPVGGVLEYADKQTISRALENRREVTKCH